MARRKKKSTSKTRGLVNFESMINQIHGQLTDPMSMQWIMSGARGVREKVLGINYNVLRQTVHKVPLIGAIINTRVDQVLPFTQYAREEGERGFRLKLTKQSEEEDDQEVSLLADMLEQTGFQYDEFREDDFSDYMQMLVREIYTIDQIATEIQYNRRGEAVAFWALDGATIKRVENGEWFDEGFRYIQEIDNKIYARFTNQNLIFDYKNKRADVRYRGFGYSHVEQCIDIITTLLFGYNYLQNQLVRDRMPKGFISVMGDAGKKELDALRNYWYAAMSGAGGQWNIPILPSGKDGIGIDFKNLSQSNKDMEYHKLILFLSGVVSAVFGMDMAEMGLKSDDSQSIINNEASHPRQEQSKNRGLNSILMFSAQHITKVLRKFTTKYRIEFSGLEKEDESQREQIFNQQLKTRRTLNEIREDLGDPPIDEDWANVVADPQLVQIYLADKQAKQQQEMQSQMGQQGMDGFGSLGGGNEGEEEESGMFEFPMSKSHLNRLSRSQERVIHHVIR